MTRRSRWGSPSVRAMGLLALALVSALPLWGCKPRAREPRPVVLIVVDTLRWDSMGVAGAGDGASPNLDALAAQSWRFERASAPAPWTQPTVASLFTGRYPSNHGLIRIDRRLPEDAVTLAEHLGSAGFDSAAVVSNRLVGKGAGLHQGFASFEHHASDTEPTSEGVTDRALASFHRMRAGDAPWFLYVHYMDPHYPYLRDTENPLGPEKVGRLVGGEHIGTLEAMAETLTPEELAFLKQVYDEEVRRTDAAIGRLLEEMDAATEGPRPIVVFTADHGEAFMTHGSLGHTRTLYEELIRVPLYLRVPGSEPQVFDEPVSLVSVAPTLYELLQLAPPDGLQGTSLLGPQNAQSYAEVDFTPQSTRYAAKTAHKRSLTVGRYKLIRDLDSGEELLFDLVSDPHETRPLSDPARLAELGAMLDREQTLAREGGLVATGKTIGDQELEALRALGYIE